jgi:hypothetical protein
MSLKSPVLTRYDELLTVVSSDSLARNRRKLEDLLQQQTEINNKIWELSVDICDELNSLAYDLDAARWPCTNLRKELVKL